PPFLSGHRLAGVQFGMAPKAEGGYGSVTRLQPLALAVHRPVGVSGDHGSIVGSAVAALQLPAEIQQRTATEGHTNASQRRRRTTTVPPMMPMAISSSRSNPAQVDISDPRALPGGRKK